MDTFFHETWRMDWGLGNPNKTGALIALLMVAVWWLSIIKRWGFWVALMCFMGLGVCLMHTFSRGGILAAFLGIIPLVFCSPRPLPNTRVVCIVVSLIVIVSSAIFLKTTDRLVMGLTTEDRSITNRLLIWKTAPRMMVDAPSGWGLGNSGNAYMQWYQPANHSDGYRTLVNNHLTWLVELGWPWRFLYIVGWLAIIWLLWPARRDRWLAVSLGIWVTLGISSLFSSVAESPWLWIIPTLALVVGIIRRQALSLWPNPRGWLVTLGLAGIICIGIFIAGVSSKDYLIRKRGEVIYVGTSAPKFIIVINETIMGKNYGKTWRQRMQNSENISAVFVNSLSDVPQNTVIKAIVFAGELSPNNLILAKAVAAKYPVMLLNPFFSPEDLGVTASTSTVTVLQGAFVQGFIANNWRSETKARFVEVVGAGEYLPTWSELVINIFPNHKIQ
jgi:O-Antigen ligase